VSVTIDRAFESLAAAVAARRLYGADHAASVGASSRAHAAMGDAMVGREYIEYHFVGPRVMGPEGVLECGRDTADAIRVPLAARQATALRLVRGLSERDVGRLVAALADTSSDAPADLCGARFGHAEIERPATAAGAADRGAASLVDSYRSAAPFGESTDPIDPANLESVAGGICAAVLGARGTMLDLAAIKSHDEYTFVHTVNVAILAAALAEECGLSATRVHQITLAALLHDLGKRAVPRELIVKSSALTEDERRIMQRHPAEGARILLSERGVPDIAAIVAYEHHMHMDGTGYPGRPASRRPHMASQIVQQADVFDALRTHRPYRAAMSTQRAVEILVEGSSTRYDPALVDVFVNRVAGRADVAPPPQSVGTSHEPVR